RLAHLYHRPVSYFLHAFNHYFLSFLQPVFYNQLIADIGAANYFTLRYLAAVAQYEYKKLAHLLNDCFGRYQQRGGGAVVADAYVGAHTSFEQSFFIGKNEPGFNSTGLRVYRAIDQADITRRGKHRLVGQQQRKRG